MAYFEHEFNDYVTIHGEMVVSRLDYDTRQYAPRFDDWPFTGAHPYSDVQPIAVGSNPGNPYRAFADGTNSFELLYPDHEWGGSNMFCREVRDGDGNVTSCLGDSYLNYHDANNNGRYDYLEEPGELLVYAQDANGDGIPDRGTPAFDADGAPLLDDNGDQIWRTDTSFNRDPKYRVVLLSDTVDSDGDGVPDRFDPDTVGAGGVRLFEDVRLRGMNLWPKNPHNNNLPWLNDDMTWRDRTRIENFRFRLGTEVSIPETEWIVDADWIWTLVRRTDDRPEGIWPMMNAALRCQGGQYGDTCWNPFSTHWLATTEEGELQNAYRMEGDATQSAWDPTVGAYMGDAVNTADELLQRRHRAGAERAYARHARARLRGVQRLVVPDLQRHAGRHRRRHPLAGRERGTEPRCVRADRRLLGRRRVDRPERRPSRCSCSGRTRKLGRSS